MRKKNSKDREIKQNQVRLRQFRCHEHLTTILNKTKQVGSEPFSHVLYKPNNLQKQLTSHMFGFV
jgi:hypothetical protein